MLASLRTVLDTSWAGGGYTGNLRLLAPCVGGFRPSTTVRETIQNRIGNHLGNRMREVYMHLKKCWTCFRGVHKNTALDYD